MSWYGVLGMRLCSEKAGPRNTKLPTTQDVVFAITRLHQLCWDDWGMGTTINHIPRTLCQDPHCFAKSVMVSAPYMFTEEVV